MDRLEMFEKITENRGMIEGLVVGTLLKDPSLFREYKLKEEDFIIEKTKFLFTLGRAMSTNFKEFDEASTLSFVSNNKKYKQQYTDNGGWNTIKNAKEYGNEANIKGYVEDLLKNNYIISSFNNNFPVFEPVDYKGVKVCPFTDIFPNTNCRGIEEFYAAILTSMSNNSITNNSGKIESLIIKKETREKLKQKENAGTQYNIMFEYTEKEIDKSESESPKYVYALPLLSNTTNGIGNGNGLKVLAAHSGIGKTTINFFDLILPMIYRGEKAVIFSNEVNATYFRSMLTSFIAHNVFDYHDLSRTKITNGDFNEDEELLMNRIEEFLERRNFDEHLKFIFTEVFDIDEIIRMSKELVTLEGVENILIDTFKSEGDDDDYVRGIKINSEKLDSFGNEYQIKMFLTMQLMPSTENKISFLSGNSLAECKAVKSVCEVLFLMRRVLNDKELNPLNKNFYLKPYRLVQDRISKKWKREYIDDLDTNRQYRLLFLDKSRRGEDNKQILLEFHGKTGHFKEIGYVENVSKQQLSY